MTIKSVPIVTVLGTLVNVEVYVPQGAHLPGFTIADQDGLTCRTIRDKVKARMGDAYPATKQITVGLTPKPHRLDAADPAIIGAIAGALMVL